MLNPSRFCNVFSGKQQVRSQILTNTVHVMIFAYLILFSIFNSLRLHKAPPLKPDQPDHYDVENVAVKLVSCSFPISSYYERTPRYICYLLLVFTVVIRNHEWLAAGAAASVLTYSGVAAIHLIILFTTNNKLNVPKAKSHCESLPIPGASTPFFACAGVTDLDLDPSMTIVGSVMLGALPILAWSTTFRRSTSKVILIFWLLLLAVGHTFYPLTEFNTGHHFQICPKDYIQPLPTANYQAPFLDQSWRDSFSSLVSTAQRSSQSSRNGSSPACIYSCFATTGYPGRRTQDIVVWDGISVKHPVLKSHDTSGLCAVMFWWVYTLLAFLTFFTTEKKQRLPKGMHKLLFSIEYRQQPLASRWKWKTVTNIAIKGTEDSIITIDSTEATTPVKIHITVLKLFQLFTQLTSVVAFCCFIIIEETQHAQVWSALSQEPFAAIGQWGSLAVVLLVLVAAGLSRIWAGTGAKSAVVEEEEERTLENGTEESEKDKAWSRRRSCLDDDDDAKSDCWRDGEDGDVETEKEDWDWRIGYAS